MSVRPPSRLDGICASSHWCGRVEAFLAHAPHALLVPSRRVAGAGRGDAEVDHSLRYDHGPHVVYCKLTERPRQAGRVMLANRHEPCLVAGDG